MYYEHDKPRPHFVSLRTGKQYFYREGTGEDRLRALRELERDDAPAPELTGTNHDCSAATATIRPRR